MKTEYDAARKLYQPKISEENVLREIVDRLWLQGKIKVWRIRERIPDNRKRWQQLSTPGIPDLMGWFVRTDWTPSPAIPLFIEVKRPGGKRRLAQECFIAEASADGCCAFFAESFHDCVVELKNYGINLSE